MPTPHISAPDGAFAPTVLMPGDPKRAARIAHNFLDGAELVTEVRGHDWFHRYVARHADFSHAIRHGCAFGQRSTSPSSFVRMASPG